MITLIFDKEKKIFRAYGASGGELEYVSQTLVFRGNRVLYETTAIVLTFTDHDVEAAPNEDLRDGKYYDIEVALNGGV